MTVSDRFTSRSRKLPSALALAGLIWVVLMPYAAPAATQPSRARSVRWTHVWIVPKPNPSPNAPSVRLRGWTIQTNLATLQADCRVYPGRVGSTQPANRSRDRDLALGYTAFYVCGPVEGAKDAYHLVRVPPQVSRRLALGLSAPESTVGPCVSFLQMLWGEPVVIARTRDISSMRPDHFWVVANPSEPCEPPGSLKIEKLITSILQTDPVTHVAPHPLARHLRGWPLGSGDKALGTKCGPYVREARYGSHPPTEIPAQHVTTGISNYYICAPRQPFKGTYQSVIVPVGQRGPFTLVLDSPDRRARHETCLANLVVQLGGPPEVIARATDGHFWLMRIPLGVCGARSYLAETFMYQLLHAGAVN